MWKEKIFELAQTFFGLKYIHLIQEISNDLNKPVGIQVDLRGNKIRIGGFKNHFIELENASEIDVIFTEEQKTDNHEIFIDADACPVKGEAIAVAARHGLKTYLVCDGGIRPSQDPMVELIIVNQGEDAADDWIAGNIKKLMVFQ